MKKFLRIFCLTVFIGGSSAAVLIGFFYLLQRMIQTEQLALQVIAVVLLLCLVLAYTVGGVLLILELRNKSRVSVVAERL